ncbi:basal body-orientation factor 1-like [Brienomyrus brachyistius]|uniref:basal body-orientation factor 1-like n=1 Tax=Brienomyrus brachyistius TaxID=42636 RepID=UPI0020B34914|nr:basal body-orientation factor 1-like [Brienomyrus brachyistius]
MHKKKGKRGKKVVKGKGKKDTKQEPKGDKETDIEKAKAMAAFWEARLNVTERSRVEYRETAHRLALANEELGNQKERAEKDNIDIIAFLKRREAEREEKISQLEEQLKEQKKAARKECEQLVAEFTLQINEIEGRLQKRSEEFQMIQGELQMIKEFRRKKAEMERELSDLKEKIETEDRNHKESLARTEHKFFNEKLCLEKEAEQRIAKLAERAHNEAIVQLDDTCRSVFKENIRLNQALAHHVKETDELRKTTAVLAQRRESLALHKETSELMATENMSHLMQQKEETAALRSKMAALEQALELMATELEKERRDREQESSAEAEAGQAETDRLRRTLKARERETNRVKLLARGVLEQRTELECFFQEALQQVRQEIRASREQYRQAAQAAYQRGISEARAGRREYPRIRTFTKNEQSTNSIYADLEEAEKWCYSRGARVDISELTWEQKEKVLRLLFAKMNGIKARSAVEPTRTTFITQEPESVLPSKPRWLPDIQTKT